MFQYELIENSQLTAHPDIQTVNVPDNSRMRQMAKATIRLHKTPEHGQTTKGVLIYDNVDVQKIESAASKTNQYVSVGIFGDQKRSYDEKVDGSIKEFYNNGDEITLPQRLRKQGFVAKHRHGGNNMIGHIEYDSVPKE